MATYNAIDELIKKINNGAFNSVEEGTIYSQNRMEYFTTKLKDNLDKKYSDIEHIHTANEVGALPITGGELTGDLFRGNVQIASSWIGTRNATDFRLRSGTDRTSIRLGQGNIDINTNNHVRILREGSTTQYMPIQASNFIGPLTGNATTATTASNLTLHSLPVDGTMASIDRNGLSQGSNITDRPPQATHQWDYIQSYRHNDRHRLQIVTDFGNRRTAQRNMDGGVWRDWKYQLFSPNPDAATRDIYADILNRLPLTGGTLTGDLTRGHMRLGDEWIGTHTDRNFHLRRNDRNVITVRSTGITINTNASSRGGGINIEGATATGHIWTGNPNFIIENPGSNGGIHFRTGGSDTAKLNIGVNNSTFSHDVTAPNFRGRLIGNADTATRATTADRLTTVRNIALAGAITGSVSTDLSGNVTINTTNPNRFRLNASPQAESWTRIADMVTAIGSGENNIIIRVSGVGNFGNSQMGVDIVQMSTRGGVPNLRVFTIIPHGSTAIQYGWRNNATRTELWIRRWNFNAATDIELMQQANTNFGNFETVTTAPSNLNIVTRTGFALDTHTHTAAQVGALPIVGGTLTGDLTRGDVRLSTNWVGTHNDNPFNIRRNNVDRIRLTASYTDILIGNIHVPNGYVKVQTNTRLDNGWVGNTNAADFHLRRNNINILTVRSDGIQVNTQGTSESNSIRVVGTQTEGRLWTGTGSFVVGATGNKDLLFMTNYAERIRITGSGNTRLLSPVTEVIGTMMTNRIDAGAIYMQGTNRITRQQSVHGAWWVNGNTNNRHGDTRALIRQSVNSAGSFHPVISVGADLNGAHNGTWSVGTIGTTGNLHDLNIVYYAPNRTANGTDVRFQFNRNSEFVTPILRTTGNATIGGTLNSTGNVTAPRFIGTADNLRTVQVTNWDTFDPTSLGLARGQTIGVWSENIATGPWANTVAGTLTRNTAGSHYTLNLFRSNDSNVSDVHVRRIRSASGAWQSWIYSSSANNITTGTFAVERIPNLPTSHINSGTFAIGRIPTGTTSTTVSLGNHTHGIADIRGTANNPGAGTNINTLYTGGAYRISGPTGTLPTGISGWVFLDIIQQGTQECEQKIRPFGDVANVWVRRSNSTGGWDAWRRITIDVVNQLPTVSNLPTSAQGGNGTVNNNISAGVASSISVPRVTVNNKGLVTALSANVFNLPAIPANATQINAMQSLGRTNGDSHAAHFRINGVVGTGDLTANPGFPLAWGVVLTINASDRGGQLFVANAGAATTGNLWYRSGNIRDGQAGAWVNMRSADWINSGTFGPARLATSRQNWIFNTNAAANTVTAGATAGNGFVVGTNNSNDNVSITLARNNTGNVWSRLLNEGGNFRIQRKTGEATTWTNMLSFDSSSNTTFTGNATINGMQINSGRVLRPGSGNFDFQDTTGTWRLNINATNGQVGVNGELRANDIRGRTAETVIRTQAGNARLTVDTVGIISNGTFTSTGTATFNNNVRFGDNNELRQREFRHDIQRNTVAHNLNNLQRAATGWAYARYLRPTTTDSTPVTNGPIASNAFFMELIPVRDNGVTDYRQIQRYITHDFREFRRTVTTGTWTAWQQTMDANGNAIRATLLATARTINGTSFNGGSNITTANWGTARNIQIGNTTKSVNGSANVTWSLAEIGAAATSHSHSWAGLDVNAAVGAATFDIRRTGLYQVNATSNAPDGNGWYTVQVISHLDTYCTQIATRFNAGIEGNVWVRRRNNGIWSGWVRQARSNETVMLTGSQTIAGEKTWSNGANFHGWMRPNAGISFNTNSLMASGPNFGIWRNASTNIIHRHNGQDRMELNNSGVVINGINTINGSSTINGSLTMVGQQMHIHMNSNNSSIVKLNSQGGSWWAQQINDAGHGDERALVRGVASAGTSSWHPLISMKTPNGEVAGTWSQGIIQPQNNWTIAWYNQTRNANGTDASFTFSREGRFSASSISTGNMNFSGVLTHTGSNDSAIRARSGGYLNLLDNGGSWRISVRHAAGSVEGHVGINGIMDISDQLRTNTISGRTGNLVLRSENNTERIAIENTRVNITSHIDINNYIHFNTNRAHVGTGINRNGDNISLVRNGVARITGTGSGADINGPVHLVSQIATASGHFGLNRSSANNVDLVRDGTWRLSATSSGASVNGGLVVSGAITMQGRNVTTYTGTNISNERGEVRIGRFLIQWGRQTGITASAGVLVVRGFNFPIAYSHQPNGVAQPRVDNPFGVHSSSGEMVAQGTTAILANTSNTSANIRSTRMNAGEYSVDWTVWGQAAASTFSEIISDIEHRDTDSGAREVYEHYLRMCDTVENHCTDKAHYRRKDYRLIYHNTHEFVNEEGNKDYYEEVCDYSNCEEEYKSCLTIAYLMKEMDLYEFSKETCEEIDKHKKECNLEDKPLPKEEEEEIINEKETENAKKIKNLENEIVELKKMVKLLMNKE